jgi:hypothetical protein
MEVTHRQDERREVAISYKKEGKGKARIPYDTRRGKTDSEPGSKWVNQFGIWTSERA